MNFSTLPLQRHLFLYCDTKIFATTKTTRLFLLILQIHAYKCYIIQSLSILMCVETYYSLFGYAKLMESDICCCGRYEPPFFLYSFKTNIIITTRRGLEKAWDPRSYIVIKPCLNWYNFADVFCCSSGRCWLFGILCFVIYLLFVLTLHIAIIALYLK